MPTLPEEFVSGMKSVFECLDKESEFCSFIESFGRAQSKAIRLNFNKIHKSDILSVLESVLGYPENGSSGSSYEKVPWTDDGWMVPAGISPGRHPYYNAGLYYIQEPSAMLPAYLAKARPGEKIMDLCAAPGGKTVKLSTDMKNMGLLVSNDINAERVRALLRNVELMGCTNCLITNERPEALSQAYPELFDTVLADVPCSGEGMFRRDENALKTWSDHRNDYPVIQRGILEEADRMLRPGGKLVYSTCTFSPEENEKMIAGFVGSHPGYSITDIFAEDYLADGNDLLRAGVVRGIDIKGTGTHMTARIFPHDTSGEGHFCAVLKKDINIPSEKTTHDMFVLAGKKNVDPNKRNEFISAFKIFSEKLLSASCISRIISYTESYLEIYQGNVYTFNIPVRLPDGIRFVKKGFFLGKVHQTRKGPVFEPSNQLIMSLRKEDLLRSVSFRPESPEISRYLKGETIFSDDLCGQIRSPGYIAVGTDGFPLGWGKAGSDRSIKNLYPKGWRKQ